MHRVLSMLHNLKFLLFEECKLLAGVDHGLRVELHFRRRQRNKEQQKEAQSVLGRDIEEFYRGVPHGLLS